MSEFRYPTIQEREYCIELSRILNIEYSNLENHKKAMLYSFIKSKYYTPEKHQILKQILKENPERKLMLNLIDFTKMCKKINEKKINNLF